MAWAMLAVPDGLVERSLVRAKPEGELSFPLFAGYTVTAPELVDEALAVCVNRDTFGSAQRLSFEKLDLYIWTI